jgi:hypothetical protein
VINNENRDQQAKDTIQPQHLGTQKAPNQNLERTYRVVKGGEGHVMKLCEIVLFLYQSVANQPPEPWGSAGSAQFIGSGGFGVQGLQLTPWY